MNNIGFSLMGFLILMIIFYIWGLISIYRTPKKYYRSWLLVAPLLIIAPMFLFVLSPFFTRTKDTDARFKAIIFLLFYLVSQALFTLFFKFGMQSTFSLELSLFSSGLASLLYLISMSIINYKK